MDPSFFLRFSYVPKKQKKEKRKKNIRFLFCSKKMNVEWWLRRRPSASSREASSLPLSSSSTYLSSCPSSTPQVSSSSFSGNLPDSSSCSSSLASSSVTQDRMEHKKDMTPPPPISSIYYPMTTYRVCPEQPEKVRLMILREGKDEADVKKCIETFDQLFAEVRKNNVRVKLFVDAHQVRVHPLRIKRHVMEPIVKYIYKKVRDYIPLLRACGIWVASEGLSYMFGKALYALPRSVQRTIYLHHQEEQVERFFRHLPVVSSNTMVASTLTTTTTTTALPVIVEEEEEIGEFSWEQASLEPYSDELPPPSEEMHE